MQDPRAPRLCPDCKTEMRLVHNKYSTVYTCDACNAQMTIPPVLPRTLPKT